MLRSRKIAVLERSVKSQTKSEESLIEFLKSFQVKIDLSVLFHFAEVFLSRQLDLRSADSRKIKSALERL